MSAYPMETPRPLPAAFHAMARAITGRAHPPRFTSGPATRNALAAAGALGATTGSVIHLPAPPTGGPAVASVLAHELTHTRRPVSRPRFLLAAAAGALDDDERSALAAGRSLVTGNGAATAAGAGGGTVAAGLVETLPVGGGVGAVADVATRAARAAVIEAGASPLGPAAGLAGGVPGFPDGGPSGFAAGAGVPVGLSAPDGAATAAPATASTGPGGPAPAGACAGAGTGGGSVAALDLDRLVDAIEERLLREIERRGGRWAGVF